MDYHETNRDWGWCNFTGGNTVITADKHEVSYFVRDYCSNTTIKSYHLLTHLQLVESQSRWWLWWEDWYPMEGRGRHNQKINTWLGPIYLWTWTLIQRHWLPKIGVSRIFFIFIESVSHLRHLVPRHHSTSGWKTAEKPHKMQETFSRIINSCLEGLSWQFLFLLSASVPSLSALTALQNHAAVIIVV